MRPYIVKVGDTSPLSAVLEDQDGPIDLTDASVVFAMGKAGETSPIVTGAAVVVSAVAGSVRYDWGASDLDVAGEFQGEFQITFASGVVATCPNGEYIPIRVLADVA